MLTGYDLAKGKDRTALTIVSASGAVQRVIDRDDLNAKKASRKADREFIASALIDIVSRHGAEVMRRDEPSQIGIGASIYLKFSLFGVGASLHVDKLHGGDHALIAWHNTSYPACNFTARFCDIVGETGIGSRRFHKATSCPSDWYSLAMMLDGGLCLAARLEAFEPLAS